ncbi:type III secretion system cytoplasmic ring protein SctQ [Aeromonas lusitana]|uniref:YscQ/HrcQ family type III secretion apparatus protein n=1 Tax=Aeromonas lusitana TaxID=931529 RepID=A0A2M8HCK6_9GAMM|nr:type III secretion system cytoplasmic ring protein SctQ [Aeromonas lusitana]PJC94270.1 YscQ/HrcQ family type III secretion apparatus protein [Aeromonas lusitana]
MKSITLPAASVAELALQRRLSQHRWHFDWLGGELCLTIGLPPASLDTRLQLHWQGLTLALGCQGAELARWLAPDLQQAALFSLPEPLQLALIERLGQPLSGLSCSALVQDATSSNPVVPGEPALQILLKRESVCLSLWLHQPEPLLARLPPRPPQQRQPLPLLLSLRWGEMRLSVMELARLACGDVLLPPPHPMLGQRLLACLEGRPLAYCQPHPQHLELIDMYTAAPDEPLGPTELESLPIQVSFEVGRQTLDWHSLTSLQPGSLIDLGVPLDGEVSILGNGHRIGVGRLVEIQGRLGVRVETLSGEPQA